MDPEFAKEFTSGIVSIMKESLASLQGRIAALETRINRLEAARGEDPAAAKTLRLVNDDR